MLLGNLVSIVLSIAGILQVLSWTIAGATILAILSITTLAPARNAAGTGTRSTAKKTARAITETKPAREKPPEKMSTRSHQAPSPKTEPRQTIKDEPARSLPPIRSEFQKVVAPKITPPKTVPTSVSPAKPGSPKPGSVRQEAIRPIPVGTSPMSVGIVKPVPPKIDPNARVIARGDYATFDVELNQRAEVVCEVTASAPVNVYLMDSDNLNSLDLGEEFWSEAGQEGVQKSALHFVAPQSGKWFLIVENTDNTQVSATVNIRKTPPKPARTE
jgi:hypothetical protein